MNIDDIIVRFKLISNLDDEEISRWMVVCRDCAAYIESHVKSEEYLRLYEKRLAYGAAVFFYYNYCLYNRNNNVTSFKAGDVQISFDNSLEYAQSLWEKEKEMLSDIVDFGSDDAENESGADSFFFRGVV